MKKLIFSAALLSAMVACQTSDELTMSTSSASSSSLSELTFGTSAGKSTKAAVDKDSTAFDESIDDALTLDTDESSTDDFAVIVYMSKNEWAGVEDDPTTTGEDADEYVEAGFDIMKGDPDNGVPEEDPFIDNKRVMYTSGTYDTAYAWRTAGDLSFWPVDKTYMLNVYAYSPHNDADITKYPTEFTANSMTIVGYTNDAETNLMTAMSFDNLRYQENSYVVSGSEIDLEFNRALSQLRFEIALKESKASNTTMVEVGKIQDPEKLAIYDGVYDATSTTTFLPWAKAALTAIQSEETEVYVVDEDGNVSDTEVDYTYYSGEYDGADGEAVYVYAGADVYLQEIKLVNFASAGNVTATLDAETGDYSTLWNAATDATEYYIYQNEAYANSTNILDTYKVDGALNKFNTTNDAEALAELRQGAVLTTLFEGRGMNYYAEKDANNYDDYGWVAYDEDLDADEQDIRYNAEAMNAFFRPLVISPFAVEVDDVDDEGNDITVNTVNEAGVDYADFGTKMSDTYITDNQPYMQFTFFVDCNGDETEGGSSVNNTLSELVVLRKPFYSSLAPNSRVSYSVTIELSELTFSPTIVTFVEDSEPAVDIDGSTIASDSTTEVVDEL